MLARVVAGLAELKTRAKDAFMHIFWDVLNPTSRTFELYSYPI